MKRGLIIVNAYAEIEGISYQSKRLKEELSLLGAQADIVTPAALYYGVEEGKNVFSSEVDFVVFLDKDRYLARMIEKSGVRMFNSAEAIECCDDKMLTYITLSDNGVPMPDTIPCMLCYTENKKVSADFLNKVASLGFPLIAKTSFGSLGKGVFLVHDFAELETMEEKLKFLPHLYQSYLSAHRGTDIRIIVIGGRTVACMLRSNPDDYRSNIGEGGTGTKIIPDPEFIAVAERAAAILQLDYCGVDLLIDDNNRPVLCEVNSNAFFTGIEKCTGINVAKKYVEYIMKKI